MLEHDDFRVSIDDIRQAFEDLLEERKSREDLASWATTLRKADDAGLLIYEPKSEEGRIWRAIKYLCGVDLMDNHSTYLHDKKNFEDFVQANLN